MSPPVGTGGAGARTALAHGERVFDHDEVARAEGLARDLGMTQDRPTGRPWARDQAQVVGAGAGAGVIEDLAGRVRPTDLARDRSMAVLPAFDALLPASGLRRGTTVAVDARPGVTGATSLSLALAAGASQAGSWVAAVGLGSLGLAAAAALGVALERLVLVADPGRERAGWATVVAALVDGFDIVLVAPGSRGSGGGLRAGDARRLVARVRERESVLVAVGGDLPGERSPLRLTVTSSTWEGLGEGWGHLQGRRVAVEAEGRGEAARRRRAELWLPGPDGTVAVAEPVAPPIPLRRPATDPSVGTSVPGTSVPGTSVPGTSVPGTSVPGTSVSAAGSATAGGGA
jgi:hypothetical protein